MNIKPTGLALLLIILLVKFSESQVSFSEQLIISNNAQEAMFVYAADLDMDGDQDVISSSGGDNKIAWYANDGAGNMSAEQVISNQAMLSTQAIVLALEHNIDIIFLDKFGDPLGRVWFSKMGSTALIRRKQLEAAEMPHGLELVIAAHTRLHHL